MSYLKDFDIYRRNHPYLSERAAREAFDHGELPSIDATNGRDLTWTEVDALTCGATGKTNVSCPYCGHPSTFQINRYSFTAARYYCFYCDHGGRACTNDPVDPIKEAEAKKSAAARDAQQKAEKSARAIGWWEEAESLRNILSARRYFAARAIQDLPPDLDNVLRWHPACPFGPNCRRPVMLALFRNALTDAPSAVLRTWIRETGRAERMAYGPIAGAAIKLWPLKGAARLFIAEGLETALSVGGMAWEGELARPVWALSVARNFTAFPVLPDVNQLMVMADNDPSGVGETNARCVVRRWLAAGREAEIQMPTDFKDWNDVVRSISK
jgi:hypothetical protein